MPVQSARHADVNGTRERLIAAAADLFARRGYEQATLAAIGAAAGVTAPALYRHFGSKDDLLLAVILTNLEEVRRQTDTALAEPNVTARLTAVVGAQLDFRLRLRAGSTGPATFTIGHLVALLPPDSRNQVADLVRQHIGTLSEVLRDGARQGVFKDLDPTPTAFAILGMLDAALWLRPTGRLSPAKVKEHFTRLVLEMVVRP